MGLPAILHDAGLGVAGCALRRLPLAQRSGLHGEEAASRLVEETGAGLPLRFECAGH
jgi:hypothetical protein